LRLAHAQVQAVANEITTIGTALPGGHIGPESALAMLHDSGLDWVVTEPST